MRHSYKSIYRVSSAPATCQGHVPTLPWVRLWFWLRVELGTLWDRVGFGEVRLGVRVSSQGGVGEHVPRNQDRSYNATSNCDVTPSFPRMNAARMASSL